MIRVEVTGAGRLAAALRSAAGDLTDLSGPARVASERLGRDTAGRAPVRTGRLRGAVRSSHAGAAGWVWIDRAAVIYAGPIYYGWPARNIRPNPFGNGPHPEPAWQAPYAEHVSDSLKGI